MATTAQAGIFGFGPQATKESPATRFWKHKVTMMDLGVLDDIRVGPLEIGSGPFPTFPYKAGYIVGGGVEMQPRLEDSIGWLLFSAIGDLQTALVDGESDVYKHTIVPASDPSYVRWMSLRKYIPMKEGDTDTDLGELFADCKPVGLTLNLANDAPITARWDFMGRTFTLLADTSAWVWVNDAYETWGSIPVGCEVGGSITFTGGGLTGESLPVVGARVTFQNQNLDPRQEKVYGSPALEDITIIQRQMTVECTIKWNNPEIYRAILTGQTTGTEWSSRPLTGAMDITAVATAFAGSSVAQKYQLNIKSESLMWQMNGPIQLAAGQAIMMRFTGTALEPTSGDYLTFELINDTPEYVWEVADANLPTIDSAEIGTVDASTAVVVFDENVQVESGSWMAGWTATVDAAPVAIVNGGQHASDALYLVLATPVTAGQVVLLSYSSAVGNIADVAGNDLADVTDQAVTNNVA